jgi:hypothetical protein
MSGGFVTAGLLRHDPLPPKAVNALLLIRPAFSLASPAS